MRVHAKNGPRSGPAGAARARRGLAAALLVVVLAPQLSVADDARAPSEARLGNPVARRSLANFPATLQRPLFSPNRRRPTVEPPPPTPVVQEPLRPPPAPPAVTLIGVIADPDGSQALLQSVGAKAIRVRVGDDVMGWRVAEIDAQRLTFTLGERAVSVALFMQKSASAPPAGAGSSERRAPHARND